MNKVFLGGTCNKSTWRDKFIPMLKTINYFNPVVEDWTTECQAEEIKQKKECDFCLYVITPKMEGVYSIAEVVDDSNKRPEKTVLCILDEDNGKKFNEHQMKSLSKVEDMVQDNGGIIMPNLERTAFFLNNI